MDKTAGSNVLRIGDYITFKSAKHNGILCAEGILLEDVTIQENIKVLDDALFCVHLQRQYSAARELQEFLKVNKIDAKHMSDPNVLKYYQALKRGADNENRLNDSYLKNKIGNVVNFGDVIQLFHVKSGKYLKVVPAQLANDERENIRVVLDPFGDIYSWIEVCPRYKIDRAGDRVLNNNEVYLKISERSNEYIHRADRTPVPGQEREVNCSLESTSWRMNIFRSSADSVDSRMLLSSELIYIIDPETRCNLTIATSKIESLDDSDDDKKKDSHEDDSQAEETAGQRTFRSQSDGDSEIIDGLPGFHEYGDIVLQYDDTINSSFLWFIETTASVMSGGPIRPKSEKVRFKHMNTSKYLKTEQVEIRADDGTSSERTIFTTTTDVNDPDIIFDALEVSNPGKYLSIAKALQLNQNGHWIERGDVLEDGSYIVKGVEDKTSALALIINRFMGDAVDSSAVSDDNDSVGGANVREPLDAYVGMSIRTYLTKYLIMTILPKSDSINTLWPTANRGDLQFFQNIIEKTVFFSQGFPISAKNVQLGIDKCSVKQRLRRQNLLREQGTIEVVLRMINKLIPITERADEIKNLPKKVLQKSPISETEIACLEMGQVILSKCFHLIYYVILDNSINQIYVADFMPVLLAHLSAQPLAGKCVTEMLSKNMELQETKIGTREIQIFVDKLRSSKMNSMYLQLLQSCCSCEGDGVDGNQGKVADLLFSDTNDIIIQLHADYVRTSLVAWQQPSLYVPSSPVPGSPLRGDTLINKGLPQLALAWTTNSIDFSPLGLFGKLSVNVEDLFGENAEAIADFDDDKKGGPNKKAQTNKKNYVEQKQAVANYFVAEMFLGAEMCLDRNYIAMHQLDALFPYEVLITVLKLNVRSDLKSAAVRLLMCLHVDRDPQATTKIPVLTRAWSDIERNEEPQLPSVELGRKYMFGLIQQIISEHITEMTGNKWDELSRHMLKMLRTLVEFNFYGSNERMKDVIEPLIAVLDRRNVASSKTKKVAAVEAEKPLPAEGESLTNDFDQTKTEEDVQESKGSGLSAIVSFAKSIFSTSESNYSSDDKNGNSVALKTIENYRIPSRYAKAPIYELETMVEVVDILAFAQKVIEDRNISLLARYFYCWINGTEQRTPPEIFEQVVEDSHALSMDVANFDDVMIDTLMFEHTALVQSALEVLMAHHSMRRTLLDNANNIQLIASHPRERQFRIVDQMLRQLEQNAETQELWGNLVTEADQAVNSQTKDILKELIDICRIRRTVLEFDEDYMADVGIQDLYRNLGCFEICMKVMGLLDSIEEEEDGEINEAGKNTKEICLLCNTLLYWFLLGNAKNQELGYQELELFLDTLDDEINSHLVVQAIFKNNEVLMRQVPHSHLASLVERIIKNGKSHHYLSLFASISHVGEKNIVENQFEIVKSLTSPGRLQKVACFFVSVDHPDYEEKRKLMAPFLGSAEDLSLDDLPPLLSYHLMFLEVLSGCTVGRMNITTVEAKVQSVFNYVDILQSILDPGTITVCKIRLSKFFYNSFIEVELKIPGLEQSADIWKLLETYKGVLLNAKEDMELLSRCGWESPLVKRQKIEYIIVCIMVIGGFFTHYYRVAAFAPDDREKTDHNASNNSNAAAKSASKVQFSLTHVDEMVIYFFTKIKEIYDTDCPGISDETKEMIYSCLDILNKSISSDTSIVTYIKPAGRGADNKGAEANEFEAAPDAEKELLNKFSQFMKTLTNDPDIKYKADNENVAFIGILEKLPFIADPVVSDVRYETLIKRLVFHIRDNIKIVNNQKRLDSRVTRTSTWIIRAFRTMIENRMGMSIYERDEEGGQEQDIAAAPVVNALNSCGATALCLDLIADGIDEKLQMEAIKLGVGLLFKEGGALEVQGIMNSHLSKTDSELFFKQVRITLQKLMAWHTWHEIIILEDGQEPHPPEEVLILRFLQLMCEGHYLPNQDIMREQPHNRVSYNLLDDYVNYLNCLSRIPCRTSASVGIRLSATILEVIQGPCEGNQVHLTLNTELVEILNRINRSKLVNDCEPDEQIELKKTAIDIFQGLLEGQGERSAVYERVLSVIHLDIIQTMSNGTILEYGDELKEDAEVKPIEKTEETEVLQTECVVLLQMLCNFKPSLYDELGISRNIEDIVGSGTAMIEVIWRGDIHRRFFHVPSICSYLAKSSKDNLVENVDRSNAENKLVDFLSRAHEMYREVKHQQLLTEMKLSSIFSRKIQNIATWITFFLALIINGILLFTYNANHDTPTLPKTAEFAITILNSIQCGVAGFVLLIFLVVRIPVKYQSLEAAGHSRFEALMYTAVEPMTIYYTGYLIFSILGQVLMYDFLPFLLLDIIVKNSTTRDVLNAVIYPRKQIAMGSLVILFIVMIYSFFLFLYFRNEFGDGETFCDTLWGCYLVGLGYGLREGGGVGDIFNISVNKRWILDISFYFVITVGMLNLIAGVIITTFGQLRENKAKRVEDTVSVCFICNIDKQVFDRASNEPEGFKTHVKIDHNMWNYMYFIFLLWEQDRDDDDGLEQYVRRAIEGNEIVWFPTNKAIRLNQSASKEESMLNELNSKVGTVESSISGKLDKFQTDINIVLEQLNQTLKQDHSKGDGTALGTGLSRGNRHNASSNDMKTLSRSAMLMSGQASGVEDSDRSLQSQSRDDRIAEALVQPFRVLFLEVVNIEGVRLPSFVDASRLHCKVEFQDEMHIIPVESISSEKKFSAVPTISFPKGSRRNRLFEQPIHASRDYLENEGDKLVRVELVLCDEAGEGSEVLALFEVTLEELWMAEESRLSVFLSSPEPLAIRKAHARVTVQPSIQRIADHTHPDHPHHKRFSVHAPDGSHGAHHHHRHHSHHMEYDMPMHSAGDGDESHLHDNNWSENAFHALVQDSAITGGTFHVPNFD